MVSIDSSGAAFSGQNWVRTNRSRLRYLGLVFALLVHVPVYFIVTSEDELLPQAQRLVDITIFPVPKPKELPPPPKVEPKPQPKPKVVRKAARPKPQKVIEKPVEQPKEGLTGAGIMPVPPAADVLDPVPPHKGVALTGNDIRTRMGGREFHLEMGRLDQQGSNRLINTVIALHADGSSKVTLTHYYFQTYHSQYSSTRSESGEGRWWIEGDRWCHRSDIINYGTKDCYDLTAEGPVVRLYYADCGSESSTLCKSGRIAAEGEVK
ncbi:hypothetical protein [Parvibaculum sp.]|uniref:hypothetical protein n=1 Tax=Parvibaculum sp. TaxID=2024848 RepID=UPI00320E749B